MPPFTPDSGSIAISLRTGSSTAADTAPCDDVLVVIRDGRIKTRQAGREPRATPRPTHLPVLDLRGPHLPARAHRHAHASHRPAGGHRRSHRVLLAHRPTRRCASRTDNAAATLLAGFTSVRNVGTYVLGADIALRDAHQRGPVARARALQASGPYLTIPHGGGDLYVPGLPGARRQRAFPCRRGARPGRISRTRANCCSTAARTCSR